MTVWDDLQQREQEQTAAIRALIGDQADKIAAEHNFGEPSAAKRGRNPRFPYVPVIKITNEREFVHTRQLKGLAYETREQAVDRARRAIAGYRIKLADDLCKPRLRAMREQYGLPRDPLETKDPAS